MNYRKEQEMVLHFIGGKISQVKILKETKKYMTIQCEDGFCTKYRVNKETGEVQDNTYHRVIKGLYID